MPQLNPCQDCLEAHLSGTNHKDSGTREALNAGISHRRKCILEQKLQWRALLLFFPFMEDDVIVFMSCART